VNSVICTRGLDCVNRRDHDRQAACAARQSGADGVHVGQRSLRTFDKSGRLRPAQRVIAVGETRKNERQHETEPWFVLPGESARAFAAFCMFRDLREARSLVSVARRISCTKQNVFRWARRWNWRERCLAYDRNLDAMHCAKLIAERRAMQRRQSRNAIAIHRITIRWLRELQGRAEADLPLHLSVAELVRLIELGAKLERAGRGDDGPEFREIDVVLGDINEGKVKNEEQ